ncbi:PmoA family protein [bacterium]|nr:PmoA family protein [bacterium]
MNHFLIFITLFTFSTSAYCDDAVHAKIDDDGKSLKFQIGGKPVFSYNHQIIDPPMGIERVYRRSGYIHPIYSPNGKRVTDDFSDDHAHQHGVFFAFVKAKTNETVVDFWNQHLKKGDVEHARIVSIDEKEEIAKVQLNHVAFRHAEKPDLKQKNKETQLVKKQRVFSETWTLSASKQLDCFVIELKSQIKNVTPKTVVIQKNHYGSFGIRGAREWRKPNESKLQFSTGTGKKRKNGNQSPEQWAAMTGMVDHQRCGVAVICSQKNFRFPQPVRLHPTMPYFSFAPMATEGFEIKSNEVLESKYRIVTFDGEIMPETIERLTDF